MIVFDVLYQACKFVKIFDDLKFRRTCPHHNQVAKGSVQNACGYLDFLICDIDQTFSGQRFYSHHMLSNFSVNGGLHLK